MLVTIDDFQIVSDASFYCKYKKQNSRNFVICKMKSEVLSAQITCTAVKRQI